MIEISVSNLSYTSHFVASIRNSSFDVLVTLLALVMALKKHLCYYHIGPDEGLVIHLRLDVSSNVGLSTSHRASFRRVFIHVFHLTTEASDLTALVANPGVIYNLLACDANEELVGIIVFIYN